MNHPAATTVRNGDLSAPPPSPHDPLNLLTPDQLCVLLKVRKSWVYDAVETGELPVVRLGRQLRFRRNDVIAYIETLIARRATQ